jgi:hypothetical protein
MEQLLKRIKSAGWIALAGFIATIIGLTLEHIDALNLGQTEKTIALIIGTAVVSQITKYLNQAR